MKKIILASSSPRRKKMLDQLGIPFSIFPNNYDEKLNPRLKPKGQVAFLAREKALAVAKEYSGDPAIIISADTILCLQDEQLIKPKSDEEAALTLSRLSGKRHSAVTALTLYDTQTKKAITKTNETFIQMKKLSKKEIDAYIQTREHRDRAGSYALDGKGAAFVSSIEGDYYTVIGLPLSILVEELRRFGIVI